MRRQCLAAFLRANMLVPVGTVRRRTCHADREEVLFVAFAVPRWAQCDDFGVQINANAARHGDGHPFAAHRLESPLKVVDQVLGEHLDSVIISDHRCPFDLEILSRRIVFGFGHQVEIFIDRVNGGVLETPLDHARLLVIGTVA